MSRVVFQPEVLCIQQMGQSFAESAHSHLKIAVKIGVAESACGVKQPIHHPRSISLMHFQHTPIDRSIRGYRLADRKSVGAKSAGNVSRDCHSRRRHFVKDVVQPAGNASILLLQKLEQLSTVMHAMIGDMQCQSRKRL